MADGTVRTDEDVRPALLLACLASNESRLGRAAEALGAHGWAPASVRLIVRRLVPDMALAAETVAQTMRETLCSAVLLVDAQPRADRFRVEMRAQNRLPRRDSVKIRAARPERISPVGPAVARTTAPVADLLRALNEAGVPVEASSDASDGTANYLLYRLLTEWTTDSCAPQVGLLTTPDRPIAGRNQEEGSGGPDTLEQAVKAACAAFARKLSHAQPRLAPA